jgi:sulfonate transport system substrate-binding protein
MKHLWLIAGLVALAAKAEAADHIKATVPVLADTAYAMYLIAADKGYFRDEDIDADVVVAGGGVATPALISGDAQFTGSPGAAIPAILKGAPIKLVLVTQEHPSYQLWAGDPSIKTLADLKGKRVAFGKGSSAHNLLVAALEKAGLSWSDITPAPLAPADATAAFVKGSVDAWSIWDPYLALAELKENARVLALDKDVHKPNAYYIANTDFVEKYPSLVAKLNTAFASEGVWAESHHEEVAKAQAEATGVDIEAVRRFVNRSSYRVVPLDAEVVKTQQAVADRFAKLGLIPKPVNVSDIVWKWTPGS